MIKQVVVTGATGYLGRFVVAELQQHGVVVRGLSRPDSIREGFGGPVEWVLDDLRSEGVLTQLVAGVDAVIHLAYEHVPGRYRGGEGDNLPGWLDANLNSSLNLLMAAQKAGVKQFVFLSSRAVFSRTEPDRLLDELHPTAPDTHYGAYKAALEAFLQSFAHVYGMKTCSIRATGVYGLTWPVERSKWWDLVCAVLHDKEIVSSGGGTEVHGADVARTIWAVLTKSGQLPDIVHLSDLYVTQREVVRLTREFTQKPGPLPPAPTDEPQNMLVSKHLAELGIVLGGRPLLEATIMELVRGAQSKPENC